MEMETWNYWAQWLEWNNSYFLQQGGIYLACILLMDREGLFEPCNGSCRVTRMGFTKESLPSPCLPHRASSEGPATFEKLLVFGKGVMLYCTPLWFTHRIFFSSREARRCEFINYIYTRYHVLVSIKNESRWSTSLSYSHYTAVTVA